MANSDDLITEFGALIQIAVAGDDPINFAANIAPANKGARSE